MLVTRDIEFDASTWDIDGSNFVGLTGILFDSEIIDTESNKTMAIGQEEINQVLDKELAEACEVSIHEIKNELYDIKTRIFNDPDFDKPFKMC